MPDNAPSSCFLYYGEITSLILSANGSGPLQVDADFGFIVILLQYLGIGALQGRQGLQARLSALDIANECTLIQIAGRGEHGVGGVPIVGAHVSEESFYGGFGSIVKSLGAICVTGTNRDQHEEQDCHRQR